MENDTKKDADEPFWNKALYCVKSQSMVLPFRRPWNILRKLNSHVDDTEMPPPDVLEDRDSQELNN